MLFPTFKSIIFYFDVNFTNVATCCCGSLQCAEGLPVDEELYVKVAHDRG